MIYIKKYDCVDIPRKGKKKWETSCGRDLLKFALNNEYRLSLDELSMSIGEYGKPYFSDRQDIFFNISHSDGMAAVIIADRSVGIDVQSVRPIKQRMIEMICGDREKKFIAESNDKDECFIKLWSLKESYIKAIGQGMSFSMKKVNFDIGLLDEITGTGKISNQSGIYFTKQLDNFMLSACVLDEETDKQILEKFFTVNYK